MSRHVKPHRWADALAGRIESPERAAMERHAQGCRRCARARERVRSASDTFPAIREQAAPDLPWDSVRARVHWSVSKERREKDAQPPRRRMPTWAWAALATTAAGVVGLVTGTAGLPETSAPVASETPRPVAPRETHPAPPRPALPPKALAGLINRLSAGDMTIDGARATDPFGQRIVAGTVIATGDSRVDVQFGDASAFALGPHSTLDVRRFDAAMIELAVDGTIDIEVAPRAAGQRFVVLAGEHAVEVRGTQFRVSHAGSSTTVACRHGLVAVRARDAASADTALVGTARRVEVTTGSAIRDARVVPLTVEELSSLAEATPITLPLWEPDTLAASSAPLEIAGAGKREVRVDGIELGLAPLRVRVMPGRHTVEATDAAGRYRRAGWVDVAVPAPGAKPAHLEVPAEPAPGSGVAARRKQLLAGIDHARLSRCTRQIAKAGLLTGTYVQVELSVDGSGAVGFLNVIDTDLPSATASCVREVLADVRFQPGAEATWREKIDL